MPTTFTANDVNALTAKIKELELFIARNNISAAGATPHSNVLVVQEPEQQFSDTSALPRGKTNKKATPHTSKSRTAAVKKPAAKDSNEKPVSKGGKLYQLKRKDYPKGGEKLKKAFTIHIRLLANLPDTAKAPKDPEQHVIDSFKSHFSTEACVASAQCNGEPLIPVSFVKVHSFNEVICRKQTLAYLGQIEEHVVEYTHAYLACFSLSMWGPNYKESPYSLFNSAMCMGAIDTFKQSLISHTYRNMKVDVAFANDMPFLIKVYYHIVHSFFYDKYMKEKRKPGHSADPTQQSTNSVYVCRSRLSEARIRCLKKNGYPKRIQKLITPKATSDDEAVPTPDGREIYYVKKRPERSQKMEEFIRLVDSLQEMTKSGAGTISNSKLHDRIHPPVEQQKASSFLKLPSAMPVDYYDPSYFNNLPPALRAACAVPQVAFTPMVKDIFNAEHCSMSTKEFQRRYAGNVLPLYSTVDPAELKRTANLESESEDDHEFDEDVDDEDESDCYADVDEDMSSVLNDEEEAEFVAFQQSKIAAQMALDDDDDI